MRDAIKFGMRPGTTYSEAIKDAWLEAYQAFRHQCLMGAVVRSHSEWNHTLHTGELVKGGLRTERADGGIWQQIWGVAPSLKIFSSDHYTHSATLTSELPRIIEFLDDLTVTHAPHPPRTLLVAGWAFEEWRVTRRNGGTYYWGVVGTPRGHRLRVERAETYGNRSGFVLSAPAIIGLASGPSFPSAIEIRPLLARREK